MAHISRKVQLDLKHANLHTFPEKSTTEPKTCNGTGSRSSEVSEADVDAAPVSLLQVKTSGTWHLLIMLFIFIIFIMITMLTIIMLISCDWTDGDEGGGGVGGGGSLGNHLASLAIEPPPDYDQVDDNDNSL